MSAAELEKELREFFDRYAAAFASGDPADAARFYHAPCIKMHGDGSLEALQTPQDIARFVAGVRKTHGERGSHESRITALRAARLGARAALATLDWVSVREDGSEVRRWRRSYALARADGAWRILTQLSHLD